MIERIIDLATPAVVGEYYIVPTVLAYWSGTITDWPVFLNRHEDGKHFNFPHHHYHIDPRFVAESEFRQQGKWYDSVHLLSTPKARSFGQFQRKPMAETSDGRLPAPSWAKLRCKRQIDYVFAEPISRMLTPHYVGQQCASSKRGWVCPHKRFPLGSFPAVDGVITCPLHGLQIDVATGKVIGPICQERAAA